MDIRATLGYVLDAISLTRQRLEGRVPLLGFCGAPVSTPCGVGWGGASCSGLGLGPVLLPAVDTDVVHGGGRGEPHPQPC